MDQQDQTDTPGPTDTEQIPDTGDLIDKTAHDLRPRPVCDPTDPSYVEPARGAVPVNPHRLLPILPAPPRTDPPTSGTVGTSLPDAPGDDPERDPEGHA